MKNLKKYIAKQDLVAKTDAGKRIKFEAGKAYYGSYDFDRIDKCCGFLYVSVAGVPQKLYLPSGQFWTDHFKYFGHCSEDVKPTPVDIVKRARIVKQ